MIATMDGSRSRAAGIANPAGRDEALSAAFRPVLMASPRPDPVAKRNVSAQPREARIVRRSLLEVGENLRQGFARDRPLVDAFHRHLPRVPDGLTNDVSSRERFGAAHVPSVGCNPEGGRANAAPVTLVDIRLDLAQAP